MTDTTTNAKAKKLQIAVRDWINKDGEPLATGEESKVAGIRYTHLPSAMRAKPDYNKESDPAPTGTAFEYFFDPANPATLMLAAFGAQTLAGNVVNSATNGPKGDKALNPISLIAERFEDIDAGNWADREAGVGIRYDRDKLIAAILAAKKEADPAPYVAKLDTKVDGKTGALVANDTKGAISWGAFVMRNPVVKGEYDKLTGTGVTLDMI